MLAAPSTVMISLNWGKLSSDNTPRPINMTSGNSTIVWPMAILNPASFCLAPLDIVDANSGPGAITPDIETATTVAKNAKNSCI